MKLEKFTSFLDRFFANLNKFGIDITGYDLDHLGYQCSSDEDYDNLSTTFSELGEMFDENVVGGRRVGLFKLDVPIVYKDYSIPAIELIAPKIGQECPSALEHAEFVISEKFDTFMSKYPSIKWDTSAVDQPMFPMVKLRLGEHMQVKFHYEPVIAISEHKKKK
jgi:predicted metalloenzyme YecM